MDCRWNLRHYHSDHRFPFLLDLLLVEDNGYESGRTMSFEPKKIRWIHTRCIRADKHVF